MDANGNPIRIIVTKGTTADCKQAIPLIEGIFAETLLADKGYDTDEIVDYATDKGMGIVIPAKKNRRKKREHDKRLYRFRHLAENAFLKLKRLRGVATRYAKSTSAFRGAIVLTAVLHWLKLTA